MNTPLSTWSETLQTQTRDALEQLPVTRDGMLHFKHSVLGFASADLGNLMHDSLLLRGRTGCEEYNFPDVDTLLEAGWAID